MERSPHLRLHQLLRLPTLLLVSCCLTISLSHAQQTAPSAQISTLPAPQSRIPRQGRASVSALQGMVETTDGTIVANASIALSPSGGLAHPAATSGDGIFRIVGVAPGAYDITVTAPNCEPFVQKNVRLNAGEVLTVEFKLRQLRSAYGASPVVHNPGSPSDQPSYRELNQRNPKGTVAQKEIPLVADSDYMQPRPDRWDIGVPNEGRRPRYHRYNSLNEEAPYKFGRWYDPFNRNMLKADYPIFGQQTFVNFSGVSFTAFDARRLPTPSGVDARNPGAAVFFGKGGQVFLDQTFRLTMDLFHGDTSFRPADWRIKITPAFNINYLGTQERGIVNRDPRNGTNRTDGHVGLQEAFVEYKLNDFGPNFDFISARAGIQQFASDFRGFIFADEQPGFRLFGNLRSNRIQYNAAYFDLLEKDTNSGLNTLQRRNQQVAIANIYIQDFGFKGYTTQFSYHFNPRQRRRLLLRQQRLPRPSRPHRRHHPHSIRADYFGWAGDGHIGRFNIDHAFYQVLGHDSLNPLAGQRVDINAQFAAVEISYDRDWIRFRISGIYSSGDDNPRDHTARGFDSIDRLARPSPAASSASSIAKASASPAPASPSPPPTASSPTSALQQERGPIQLRQPRPRTLVNAGVDFDITPKLRGFGNVSELPLHPHPTAATACSFKGRVRSTLGTDFAIGATYRPQLSENIILHHRRHRPRPRLADSATSTKAKRSSPPSAFLGSSSDG